MVMKAEGSSFLSPFPFLLACRFDPIIKMGKRKGKTCLERGIFCLILHDRGVYNPLQMGRAVDVDIFAESLNMTDCPSLSSERKKGKGEKGKMGCRRHPLVYQRRRRIGRARFPSERYLPKG